MNRILVIGASGQIGTELVMELRSQYGSKNVVASDIKDASDEVKSSGPFEMLNILDPKMLRNIIDKYNIKEVYLLAALLSATAEQKPMTGWDLNMNGLFNVLELAKNRIIDKIFWPSSIAVFGPSTPKMNTPQATIMEPTTVYGISKQSGERWCEYYHNKYGVDVRSIRYPGLIGYKSAPGGGTTDYAVTIYHDAIRKKTHECFLKEDTYLPMMYMPDAIKATIDIMKAPASSIKIRSSYNISGISFSPEEIHESIKAHYPEFKINYSPDYRQTIADSWPHSIDDSEAKADWGWKASFNLVDMTKDMIKNLS